MTRSQWIVLFFSGVSAVSAALGCQPGGVGDPCIPEDEYTPTFSGFGYAEANVESRSFQCETRVCIVNHFQGRVTCPYGQTGAEVAPATAPYGYCYVPASAQTVSVPVDPQLLGRRAENTVYCSCRCQGSDTTAKYCSCPSGYSCLPLVPDLGLGKENLAGSYCMKTGTTFTTPGPDCRSQANDCDTAGTKAGMNPSGS